MKKTIDPSFSAPAGPGSGFTGQSVSVTVAEGAFQSPSPVTTGGVELSPLTPGTSDVSATIPGFITTPDGTRAVTVTEP